MTTLFGHSIRSELLLLYVAEALACFAAIYLLMAWQLAQGTPIPGSPLPGGEAGGAAVFAAILALCVGIISGVSGLYQPEAWARGKRLLLGTFVASMLLLLLAWPALRLLGPSYPARLGSHLAEILLVFTVIVMTTRLGFSAAVRHGLLKRRLLVLRGAEDAADATAGTTANLAEGRPGSFEVVRTLRPGDDLAAALAPERLRAQRVWAVIAAEATLTPLLRQRCAAAGVRLFSETEFDERQLSRVVVERLPEAWIKATRAAREGNLEVMLRRILDLALGLFLVLLTLPVLLLTALAIKLDSPGPIFYRQERVGRDGRGFMLFKFRSMVVDAEVGGTPCWAVRQDPRVTRVGRFIRLTRIDEIPQVLNVVRGDMAFVGPRPERPGFVEQLGQAIPHYHDRAVVRPGITGWAQVNYPYGASVEDARMKLAYDLYYVHRRSLFLDLLILVATVRVVLFQEGSR
jgi:exopolysaccharide biosynthesis polyprenyl glycosylphosphotransferase